MTLPRWNSSFTQTPAYKILSKFFVLGALFLILSVSTPNFLMFENLITIGLQVAVYAILAYGISFVLIAGTIDLSVGSILGLSGIVCSVVLRDSGADIGIGILAGICTGVLCGVFNGFLVTRMKLLPFIATLATLWIYRGFVYIISSGMPVTIRNPDNPSIAERFSFIGSGRIFGLIPFPVLLIAIFLIICYFVLSKTVLGRNIYAVGSNEEASRLSGINVINTKMAAFSIAGGMGGLAGILMTARLSSALPGAGTTYELEGIAASVIGGVSLTGGEGSVTGACIGAFVMGMIRNGLNLNGVDSFWQQVIIGFILIIAMFFDLRRRRTSG